MQIGDALLSLRAKLNVRDYQDALKSLRLTPVAAWDYDQICKNAVLREKLKDSDRLARPEELAILANLPEARLRSILKCESRMLSPEDNFAHTTISRLREDHMVNVASRFGWPRIDVRPDESWMVTLIPTKMGAPDSFFIRLGLHENGEICPRTTDANLGGYSTAPCPSCDGWAKSDGFDPNGTGLRLKSHWAVFCIVSEISNEGELRTPTTRLNHFCLS